MSQPPAIPSYALSPHHPPLTRDQERALADAIGERHDAVQSVVVTTACSTNSHHLIEITTTDGPILIIAPVEPDEAPPV